METLMQQQEGWGSKPTSIFLQGKIAYLRNGCEKALKAFTVIQKDYRKNSNFYYFYGITYLKLNQTDEAKIYIKRSIKLGYGTVDEETKLLLDL